MRISYITVTIILSILFGVNTFSFSAGQTDDESKLKSIVVSILPLKYIIENISGNSIEIYSLVNNIEHPETYNVSAKELFILENADMYFSLGNATTHSFFRFEQAVQQTLQQKSSTVTVIPLASEVELVSFYDTVENFLEDEEDSDIEHQPDESHHHTAYDNHIWLDTAILKTIALKVYTALIQSYPSNTEMYEKNYYDFLTKIENIDKRLEVLHTLKQKKILVVHPSLGYLAKKFSFTQVSLEWLGKERGIRDIIMIENTIKENGITVLYTQSTVNIEFAKNIIQQFKLRTININPLKEDILQNLLDISHSLQMSAN